MSKQALVKALLESAYCIDRGAPVGTVVAMFIRRYPDLIAELKAEDFEHWIK